LDAMKRLHVRRAVELCKGNRKEAARRLAIHVKTVNSLMEDPGSKGPGPVS